jgi:hypothetical protein
LHPRTDRFDFGTILDEAISMNETTSMSAPHADEPGEDGCDASAVSSALPPELVEATAREAARDADRVGRLLHELGFVPSPDRPVRLPATFLLNLAAAVRMRDWELGGLHVHLSAGLPDAEHAIIDAFGLLAPKSGAEPRHSVELSRKVVALFADRFAWLGRRDWDAAFALDALDEESAVDALAELLWSRRHEERGGKA